MVVKQRHCYVKMTSACGILSQRIYRLLEDYYKLIKKTNGEQEKESIICVRVGLKNMTLGITVCHHSAGLMMPNNDPRDRFFYPSLTLMMDSYNLTVV